MWINAISNAISQVSSNAVTRVSQFDSEKQWSDQEWKDYNEVASAIVEPFIFPGSSNEDEDFYYERTERDGFAMVKANLPGIENREEWIKVIDLVEKIGY